MTNKLTLSCETAAPWSEDEKDDLLNAWVKWMVQQDGDVDPDSADIEVVDTATVPDDSAKKAEIIAEFVKNSTIVATVTIDPEGIDFTTNLD